MPNKFNKEDVHFEHPAKGMADCDECMYYLGEKAMECTRVKGSVAPHDWCDQYNCKPDINTGKTMHEHDKVRSRTTGRLYEIQMGPHGSGLVPMNPFASLAQERYMHANPEVLGKEKLAEFDAASKGKKLPKRVKKGK